MCRKDSTGNQFGFRHSFIGIGTIACSRETDLNVVVDQVQNVLLGPLMQNLRAQNPDAPDITPALTQILDGFRGLNAIVSKKTQRNDMDT